MTGPTMTLAAVTSARDAAEAELAAAQSTLDALLSRIDDGERVTAGQLAKTQDAVNVATLRLDAADD